MVRLCDFIYDQDYNSAFHDKLESIQYNACLVITGAIRGTSREKRYQELGLESVKSRHWFRKLCHFIRYSMKNPPRIYLIPNLILVGFTILGLAIISLR